MVLKESEKTVLQDLMTQEKNCVEKYTRYAKEAKDPVLSELFSNLRQREEDHFNSLGSVLNGETVPECNCNDYEGNQYSPKATYSASDSSEDMKNDCFLATDSIGSEKLTSMEYNTDVFAFSNSDVRRLLADIQIEEQNHAEMLRKYKNVNCMA